MPALLTRAPAKAPSIFLLDVLLHVPTHLDQTAPNLLEERNHLVDLGIARHLELSLAGLCARRSRNTGHRQPTRQSSFFIVAFSPCRRTISVSSAERSSGTTLQAQPASLRLHCETAPVRVSSRSTPSATGLKL